MSQEGLDSSDSLSANESSNIEPLPGLEAIFQELLREDGYDRYLSSLIDLIFYILGVDEEPCHLLFMLNEFDQQFKRFFSRKRELNFK